MSLITGELLHRYQWTSLPMPQEALNRVHQIEEQGQAVITNNFEFEMEKGTPYPDHDEQDDEDNHDITSTADVVHENNDIHKENHPEANEDAAVIHQNTDVEDAQINNDDDNENAVVDQNPQETNHNNNNTTNDNNNTNDIQTEQVNKNNEENNNDEPTENDNLTTTDNEGTSNDDTKSQEIDNDAHTHDYNLRKQGVPGAHRNAYEKEYQNMYMQFLNTTNKTHKRRTIKHYKGRKRIRIRMQDQF